MTRRSSRRAEGERGETLVEVLIALGILGIAFVAILAGMATSINLSGRQRGQANADVVLVSAAESVKSQQYVACATASTYPASGVTLPSGWTAVERRGLRVEVLGRHHMVRNLSSAGSERPARHDHRDRARRALVGVD